MYTQHASSFVSHCRHSLAMLPMITGVRRMSYITVHAFASLRKNELLQEFKLHGRHVLCYRSVSIMFMYVLIHFRKFSLYVDTEHLYIS